MGYPEGSDNKRFWRRLTREVMVGNVGIGGINPVRVQSMTSTPTLDTGATVEQIMRIADAGADIVRMTVQNIREADNLETIRSELHRRKYSIPLVADIHFNPAIAEKAAAIVDKVRINPGNYGISQGRAPADLSDEAYRQELSKAREALSRLIYICREHGTALRIGVNHGSLSPRIIYRYGNTPEGMVTSAMEFIRFCAEENFHEVVISLKSSNTLVMVHANRLMVEHMTREGMNYPLHLGVTEAGEGEEGRIRSAVGIGTLLWEGTGDTIRVSLTEDPEREIPVARKLLEHIERQQANGSDLNNVADKEMTLQHRLIRRESRPVPGIDVDYLPAPRIGGDNVPYIGGNNVPVVISSSSTPGPDYIFSSETSQLGGYPLVNAGNYLDGDFHTSDMIFVQASVADLSGELLQKASWDKRVVFVAVSLSPYPLQEMRQFILYLSESGCGNPVIFKKDYNLSSAEDFQIAASADFAPFFIERACDGLWLDYLPQDVFHEHSGSLDPEAYPGTADHGTVAHGPDDHGAVSHGPDDYGPDDYGPDDYGPGAPGTSPPSDLSAIAVSTAYSILQSTRSRFTKTEFISCPSCGRTMFNIQKATAEVKKRTSHLRGLKIAVMGCIVNGPGEMFDADYGYVGSGRGKVTLYKKQTIIKCNLPEENALDELIGLIKEGGDWREES